MSTIVQDNLSFVNNGELLINTVYKKYISNKNSSLMSFEDFLVLIQRLIKGKSKNHIDLQSPKGEKLLYAIFCYYDMNLDGYLNYEEFRNWWLDPLRESFLFGKEKKNIFPTSGNSIKGLFSYFTTKNHSFDAANELLLIYDLYEKYTKKIGTYLLDDVHKKEELGQNVMTVDMFYKLINDMGVHGTIYDYNDIDKNSDGIISFREFYNYMKKNK